jgi:P27 family predicted phage terminase small subunit
MPTKRKSLDAHELSGTKARYDDEPMFASGRPKMPAGLSAVAIEEWKRIVPKLCRRKQLTKADASLMELYVRIYSRWRTVEAIAAEHPFTETSWLDKNGVEHIKVEESPASKIAARLESQLRALLIQMSATPVSRKLTKPPKVDNPDPESKEEAALLHRTAAAEQKQVRDAEDQAMLDAIPDSLLEEPQNENEKLLQEAEQLLAAKKVDND